MPPRYHLSSLKGVPVHLVPRSSGATRYRANPRRSSLHLDFFGGPFRATFGGGGAWVRLQPTAHPSLTAPTTYSSQRSHVLNCAVIIAVRRGAGKRSLHFSRTLEPAHFS